jgi:hypothetical protein
MGQIDDLQGKRSYSGTHAHDQSKLANVLCRYEPARRLWATSVTVNVLHPRVGRTSFGAENRPAFSARSPLVWPFMKPAVRGAATSIHLATAAHRNAVRATASTATAESSAHRYDGACCGITADLVGW